MSVAPSISIKQCQLLFLFGGFEYISKPEELRLSSDVDFLARSITLAMDWMYMRNKSFY